MKKNCVNSEVADFWSFHRDRWTRKEKQGKENVGLLSSIDRFGGGLLGRRSGLDKRGEKKRRKVDVSSVRKRLIRRDRGSLRCERLLHSNQYDTRTPSGFCICITRGPRRIILEYLLGSADSFHDRSAPFLGFLCPAGKHASLLGVETVSVQVSASSNLSCFFVYRLISCIQRFNPLSVLFRSENVHLGA